MMTLERVIAISVLLVCASASAELYNDEAMYDKASTFKDLAQRVDGFVKFSGDPKIEPATLLQKSGAQPILDKEFRGYKVELEVQGQNVVMVLCDKDVALIEDAGCNAKLDGALWKQGGRQSCQVQLQAAKVCN